MNIARQTTDTLVLHDNNWAGIAFGLIFTALGILFSVSVLAERSYSSMWFPVVFVAVGIFLLATSKLVTVVIERMENSILLVKKGVFGKKEERYRADQVSAIEVRESYSSKALSPDASMTMPHRKTSYRTVFVFAGGKEAPIDHAHMSSSVVGGMLVSGVGKEREVASAAAIFLGVPFRDLGV